MTTITPADLTAPIDPHATRERALAIGKTVGRYVIAYGAALVIFGAIVMLKGANPVTTLTDMVKSTLDARSMGDVLDRTAPYLLGALAVAVPARAGLVNVGGEGQIVIGCVGAALAARWFDGNVAGAVLTIRYEGALEDITSTPQNPVFDPTTIKSTATGGGPITAANINELDGYPFIWFEVDMSFPVTKEEKKGKDKPKDKEKSK